MRIPKIYLETTIFNYYFDVERGEEHIATRKLFERIAEDKYEPYTSLYVTNELEETKDDGKRERMLALIARHGMPVLAENDEAVRLTEIYVRETVMPLRFRTDGLHIALATVNDLDMVISANFQHIVKQKTIKLTGAINTANGYHALQIYSPTEVLKFEKTRSD